MDLSTDFTNFPHFHQELIHFQIHYCKVTVAFGCSCKNNRHNCNSLWFSCYVLQIKFFQKIKIIFISDLLMYPFEKWFIHWIEYWLNNDLYLLHLFELFSWEREKVSSQFYSYCFKSTDKNFYVEFVMRKGMTNMM